MRLCSTHYNDTTLAHTHCVGQEYNRFPVNKRIILSSLMLGLWCQDCHTAATLLSLHRSRRVGIAAGQFEQGSNLLTTGTQHLIPLARCPSCCLIPASHLSTSFFFNSFDPICCSAREWTATATTMRPDDQFNSISDSPSLNLKFTFPTHKNNLRTTVISYVCITVGAGIISLPYALAESGWLGVLLIAVTSLVCVQTANWLVACMYCHDEPLKTYEAIGVAALGQPGKIIVAVFQNITLYGVCCIFLIIAGGNLSALFPSLSMHAWVLIVGGVLIPASWLKMVKETKPPRLFWSVRLTARWAGDTVEGAADGS